jgi:S1-C subfamily serine protease
MKRTTARRLAAGALVGVALAVVAFVALQAAHSQDPGDKAARQEPEAGGLPPPLRPATFEEVYERVAPAVVIVYPEGASFIFLDEQVELPERMQALLDRIKANVEQPEAEPELAEPQPEQPEVEPEPSEPEPGLETEQPQDEEEQQEVELLCPEWLVKKVQRAKQAVSSGFIVDGRGYVITNARVAAEEWSLHVLLSDGTDYEGRVVGKDPWLGVALVKIVVPEEETGKVFPVVELGDSDQIRPGAWVSAFGRPVGFPVNEPEPVMTVGTVAGVNRAVGRRRAGPLAGLPRFLGLIQTDAVIEVGSAGGPLVNTEGKVVGVNVPGGTIPEQACDQGQCNFAVPINVVASKIAILAEGAGVSHPMKYGAIDARIETLNEFYAEVLHLKGRRGVHVRQVIEGGAAARAGMQDNDVIFSVNGRRVVNVTDFIRTVAHLPIGKPARFEVSRLVDDQPRTMMIDVTLSGKTLEEIGDGEPE